LEPLNCFHDKPGGTRSHPFRHFKNALLDHPNVREDWFRFYNEKMIELALDRLKENELT